MVAAVDDGGAVRARKDVGGRKRTESPQHCGLGAQSHLLPVAQQAYRKKGIRRQKDKTRDKELGCGGSRAVG